MCTNVALYVIQYRQRVYHLHWPTDQAIQAEETYPCQDAANGLWQDINGAEMLSCCHTQTHPLI
jgi:hypothetical protein